MQGLSRDNSERIGFVVSALMSGAIDVSELRKWAERILVSAEEYPLWLVDLLDFNQAPCHIHKVIGFSTSSGLSEHQSNALQGIALAINRTIDTTVCSEILATQILDRNPEILTRFKSEFPFLTDSINQIR